MFYIAHPGVAIVQANSDWLSGTASICLSSYDCNPLLEMVGHVSATQIHRLQNLYQLIRSQFSKYKSFIKFITYYHFTNDSYVVHIPVALLIEYRCRISEKLHSSKNQRIKKLNLQCIRQYFTIVLYQREQVLWQCQDCIKYSYFLQ